MIRIILYFVIMTLIIVAVTIAWTFLGSHFLKMEEVCIENHVYFSSSESKYVKPKMNGKDHIVCNNGELL